MATIKEMISTFYETNRGLLQPGSKYHTFLNSIIARVYDNKTLVQDIITKLVDPENSLSIENLYNYTGGSSDLKTLSDFNDSFESGTTSDAIFEEIKDAVADLIGYFKNGGTNNAIYTNYLSKIINTDYLINFNVGREQFLKMIWAKDELLIDPIIDTTGLTTGHYKSFDALKTHYISQFADYLEDDLSTIGASDLSEDMKAILIDRYNLLHYFDSSTVDVLGVSKTVKVDGVINNVLDTLIDYAVVSPIFIDHLSNLTKEYNKYPLYNFVLRNEYLGQANAAFINNMNKFLNDNVVSYITVDGDTITSKVAFDYGVEDFIRTDNWFGGGAPLYTISSPTFTSTLNEYTVTIATTPSTLLQVGSTIGFSRDAVGTVDLVYGRITERNGLEISFEIDGTDIITPIDGTSGHKYLWTTNVGIVDGSHIIHTFHKGYTSNPLTVDTKDYMWKFFEVDGSEIEIFNWVTETTVDYKLSSVENYGPSLFTDYLLTELYSSSSPTLQVGDVPAFDNLWINNYSTANFTSLVVRDIIGSASGKLLSDYFKAFQDYLVKVHDLTKELYGA